MYKDLNCTVVGLFCEIIINVQKLGLEGKYINVTGDSLHSVPVCRAQTAHSTCLKEI